MLQTYVYVRYDYIAGNDWIHAQLCKNDHGSYCNHFSVFHHDCDTSVKFRAAISKLTKRTVYYTVYEVIFKKCIHLMGACTIEIEYTLWKRTSYWNDSSQQSCRTCATNRQPVAITRKTSAVG